MPDKPPTDRDDVSDDNLTVDVGAGEGARVRGGRLQAESSDAFLIVREEVQVIGRAAHCALFVNNDPEVSRIHVEVQATPRGARLRDRSTTGTFLEINGVEVRITEAYLVRPCKVRVGPSYRLLFTPELLAPEPRPKVPRFGGLLGTSPAMIALFGKLQRHAASQLSVLIGGESGTGKERVARAIHDESPRRDKPFVSLNCAEITAYSLEDTLFGHVRGAYTGADRDRAGAFVQADGGTLFLDEVALLGEQQGKLLRALQEKEVAPLGCDKPRRVDVRCLFATNVDLTAAVEQGAFREDLYFRLAQVRVEVPPLRERVEDIPLLVQDILEELNRPDVTLDRDAMAELKAHGWRGNVRELFNVLAGTLSGLTGTVISKLDVQAALPAETLQKGSYAAAKQASDRAYYTRLFGEHAGNVTQMAKVAGVDRKTISKYLRTIGLRERSPQPGPDKASKPPWAVPIRLDSWRRPR